MDHRCGAFRLRSDFATSNLGVASSFSLDEAQLVVHARGELPPGAPPSEPAPHERDFWGKQREEGEHLADFTYGFGPRSWTFHFHEDDPRRVDLSWTGDVTAHDVGPDLNGPVLALLLRRQGTVCLHGGAVETPGGEAVAILGDSGRGKSTTLHGAMRAGLQLLSDDVVALSSHEDAVLPWHDRLLLHPEACERLAVPPPWRHPHTRFHAKFAVRPPDRPPLDAAPRPLRAVLVLAPRLPARSEPVVETVTGAAALHALMPHGFPRMHRPPWGTRLCFERLVALLRRVPVFSLAMPESLEGLDASLARVLDTVAA